MFKSKKPSKKLFSFFATFKEADFDPENISKCPALSITVTQEEAMQVVSHQLFLRHHDHYKAWCDCEGVEYGFSSESWERYCSIFFVDPEEMEDEDKYCIVEIKYNMEAIASILRMFSNCTPQFVEFENPMEWSYFVPSKDSQPEFQKTMAYLNKVVSYRPELKQQVREAIDESLDYFEHKDDIEIEVELEN